MECHYCHDDFLRADLTKDHIFPKAKGGLDVRWNIVLACAPCNVRKSDNFPTCRCAICMRSRRRHWEQLGLRNPVTAGLQPGIRDLRARKTARG